MCLSIEHIEITYVHRITCNYTIVSWSITYVYDDLLLIFLPLIKDWNLNDFFFIPIWNLRLRFFKKQKLIFPVIWKTNVLVSSPVLRRKTKFSV